jgi:glycosyltransferase involved in cell wall biosynthesis
MPLPPQISIIIAAYNEEGNIADTIERVRMVMPAAEIIVVDDGSSDKTLSIAQGMAGELMKVVAVQPNRGKGHAIRMGIDKARGGVMAQIDADLQFPAEGFPVLLRPVIENEADITFGSRYLKESRIDKNSVTLMKRLASYVMAWIITVITRQRYTDVFAGFKAWKADVIRDIDLKEDGFTYEAEIAIKAKRKGYRVLEVPTGYKQRSFGNSNIRLIYHTFSIGNRILRLAMARD